MEIIKEAEVMGDGSSSSAEATTSLVKSSSNSRKGMKREVYKAAENGSVDELQWLNNWKQERTAGGNNVLHVHLSRTKDVRSGILDEDVSMSFIRYVIDETSENSAVLESNDKGDTPLHFAARFGHIGAVQEFLKRSDLVGAGLLNKANNCKDTALHDATRAGRFGMVGLLFEAGGENALNNLGETPLFIAAEKGYLKSFKAILGHTGHTALEHKGPCGHTALHAAVLFGNTGVVNQILETDTNSLLIRVKNDQGQTPLHLCATGSVKKYGSILRALLDHDDEYNSAAYIQDNDGRTPLHIATLNFNFNGAEMLIHFYPDCIEMVDNKGQNMMHFAASIGSVVTFEKILRKMPKFEGLINDRDNEGNTPLHILADAASNLSFYQLRRLFLKRKKILDVGVYNNKNLTAGDINAVKDELRDKVTGWETRRLLPKGRRIRIGTNRAEGTTRAKTIDDVLKKGNLEKKEREINRIQRMGDTHLLVAALIATMSFAAGFTLPGGVDQSPGKTIGLAVFAKKTSFIVFLISDTIAFTMSSIAVICYFSAATSDKLNNVKALSGIAYALNVISLGALVTAFVAGVCTMISQFPDLAFTILAISLFYFFSYLFLFVYLCTAIWICVKAVTKTLLRFLLR